jgi:adenylosuccinate lyase
MNDRRVHPNATAIDSVIYSDIFSTRAMREVWSDRSRIQYYLDFEKALALTQTQIGVIPGEAADEISLHCNVDEMDFAKLKAATERAAIFIAVSQGKGRLIDLLSNDPEIAKFLDHTAIERLIEPTNYLGNSGAMVDRVLAGRGE